jgi:hypothetical protein
MFFMEYDPEGPGIFGLSDNPAIRCGGIIAQGFIGAQAADKQVVETVFGPMDPCNPRANTYPRGLVICHALELPAGCASQQAGGNPL